MWDGILVVNPATELPHCFKDLERILLSILDMYVGWYLLLFGVEAFIIKSSLRVDVAQ